MDDLRAEVASQQQETAGPQDPAALDERVDNPVARHVDQGVERGDTAVRLVRDIEGQEIAHRERDLGGETPGLGHHRRGQVDPHHVRAAGPQIAGHLTRTAPQIADRAQAAHIDHEAIQ